MTPYLPYQDIYELPLLKNKSFYAKVLHIFSNWLVHPIKRRLAKKYLEYLKRKSRIKVIGITGSAGKSTTTKILDSILKLDGETVSTPPGIDPVFNIPNTILKCSTKTKYLILEMSVEFPGEMDYYLWIAKPNMAVITNIMASHLEFFKDLEGVMHEKGKLVKSLNKTDVAFFNDSDINLQKFSKKIDCKVEWFKSDVDPMVQNFNTATKVAKYLKINSSIIEKGISDFKTPEHRLELIHGRDGLTILDDSYNSNPSAAVAAIKYFVKISKGKPKIAVLGDMLQMGEYEETGHRLVGKEASKYNFEVIIGVGKSAKYILEEVGKNSKNTKTLLVSNVDLAYKALRKYAKPGFFVLVKGSRSIGLDKLVREMV